MGENLKLIVTDGAPGLIKAVDLVYPHVPRQRCWAHKLRNVADNCRRKNQEALIAGARLIYLAKTRRDALAAFKRWRTKWIDLEPKAINILEEDMEELFAVFALPEDHRITLRTTNVIERLFREVRRRTRPMSCFTNAASCDRIIYAVLARFNRRWEDRPLARFTQQS